MRDGVRHQAPLSNVSSHHPCTTLPEHGRSISAISNPPSSDPLQMSMIAGVHVTEADADKRTSGRAIALERRACGAARRRNGGCPESKRDKQGTARSTQACANKKGEQRPQPPLPALAVSEPLKRVFRGNREEAPDRTRLMPSLVVIDAVRNREVRIERRLAIQDVLDREIDVQILDRRPLDK